MKKLFLMAILACLSACNKPRDHKDMADYHKPVRGDYWATRYSYPTFQYQQNWLAQARKEHQKVAQRTPAGIHRQLADLKGMKTDAFVALGPKPLIGSSNFSGRVNVIVSHPTDPSMAWAGVDGGGVWKTTTCCDANTQWKVVTDQAEINGAAIGDLHLDPNDPDIIYAGTGDLRYGSYSFGSAGLLRSSDGGTSAAPISCLSSGPA